jgi:hypothetical protein
MTAPAYGPSRANSGVREIEELRRDLDALKSAFDKALKLLTDAVGQRLEDEVGTWGDVPERLARVEDLLAPMKVDPATPEVEWHYRRGDGILRPAPTDPEERLALIASGVPLIPVLHQTREDGRLIVLPLPAMSQEPDKSAS